MSAIAKVTSTVAALGRAETYDAQIVRDKDGKIDRLASAGANLANIPERWMQAAVLDHVRETAVKTANGEFKDPAGAAVHAARMEFYDIATAVAGTFCQLAQAGIHTAIYGMNKAVDALADELSGSRRAR